MPIGVHLLENSIQSYAWGSRTAIAELQGLPSPSATPQAELWMGAHPKAPSCLVVDGERVRLDSLIARSPVDVLGRGVACRFDGRLPFLLKVLAAAEPLSIQAHPNKAQAEQGFARENAAGVPLDAPNRNYRDANHKPEVLAALTEMWALYGFREPAEAAALMAGLGAPSLRPLIAATEGEGPRGLLVALFGLASASREAAIREALEQARIRLGDPLAEWMARLQRRYPGDPGVLAPLFLNLVRVSPGQAVYLAAGELHAYLDGTGVELMANSDNVLRGGLTPKHVDVPELLRTLTFQGERRSPMEPRRAAREEVFDTPAAEFRLSRITLTPGAPHACARDAGESPVEILLVTRGTATVAADRAPALELRSGQSCLVASAAGSYSLTGAGTVYRATVP